MGLIVDERGFTRWVGERTEQRIVTWQWPDSHLTFTADREKTATKDQAEKFAQTMRNHGAMNVQVHD